MPDTEVSGFLFFNGFLFCLMDSAGENHFFGVTFDF